MDGGSTQRRGKGSFPPRRDQEWQAREKGGHLCRTHAARPLAAMCVHRYEPWLELDTQPKTQAFPYQGSVLRTTTGGWYRDHKLPSDKKESWSIQKRRNN